ncbi:MAG: hypothetical protein ACQSGP_10850 [Frankia sp.]
MGPAGHRWGEYLPPARPTSGTLGGFATTASISLGTVSQFGSSTVRAVFYATQTDGSVKIYQSTYTVSNGLLVGADIRQTG